MCHLTDPVQPDGRLENTPDAHNPEGFSTFFSETSSGKHVPRSLYIDLEPNVVDEVRNGKYRSLFHPETMITGKEDAASNCLFLLFSRVMELTKFYPVRRTGSLYNRKGADRQCDGQSSTSGRQLHRPSGLLRFPLLRWWDGFWSRRAYPRAAVHRLWKEEQARVQRLPCADTRKLGCRAI
jgi:hypothetical protein